MTETFLGSALRGDIPVPALPDWRLAVTKQGRVLMASGSGAMSAKETRVLARALHRAARMAEGEKP